VIGIAEFGGEGLVAGLTDRVGKKRAIASGITTTAFAYLAFPLLGQNLPGSLLGLFLIFITFEFSYVSAISLMTELTPDARATLMAGYMAAAALGRMLGAVIGPALYSLGILANSLTSSVLALLALVILVIFVRVE
jgi:predicted MFS family arabinose efflux permease